MAAPAPDPAASSPPPPPDPALPTNGNEKTPLTNDTAISPAPPVAGAPAPTSRNAAPPASAPVPSLTAPNPSPSPSPRTSITVPAAPAPAAPGAATATPAATVLSHDDDPHHLDFETPLDTNNDLPTAATLSRIANFLVLDRHGKSHPFRSLYTGKHVARRVLIIFVRHFFCGNCQEYLRSVSTSISPDSLLRLPISTFIAVIGCGDPGLIDMYAAETGCPFPIYADPTRKLYEELGMIRTLALGTRPAYTKQHLLKSSLASVMQGLKQLKTGLATKGGDARQIGGEFLFEPVDLQSPVSTPFIGGGSDREGREGGFEFGSLGVSESSLDGKGGVVDESGEGEQKRVTWCHRMRTTRDHAEIPELMEVLGLDGTGVPIADQKRWIKAVESRKGTGLSMAGQMKAEAVGNPVAAASS